MKLVFRISSSWTDDTETLTAFTYTYPKGLLTLCKRLSSQNLYSIIKLNAKAELRFLYQHDAVMLSGYPSHLLNRHVIFIYSHAESPFGLSFIALFMSGISVLVHSRSMTLYPMVRAASKRTHDLSLRRKTAMNTVVKSLHATRRVTGAT